MRDPARIDTVLEQLREVWMMDPDLRLGQLIYNAARMRDPDLLDVFNIEDGTLCKGLRRYKEAMLEAARNDAKS